MGLNCLRAATDPLRRGGLLYTTQFPGVPGTHLIDRGRIKGCVAFGVVQRF